MEPEKINEVFLNFLMTVEMVFIPRWKRQLCHNSKKARREHINVKIELGQISQVTL